MNCEFNLISILDLVEDPRIDRTKLHQLSDILFIAICSSICGIISWEGMEAFAEERLDWFKKFIPLENGVPSHDTFRRVFERIDPKQLQLVLKELVQFLNPQVEGKVVAIDGKSLRGTLDSLSGIAPIHTLSAWASDSRLVLGECDVDKKENEITRIPYLLKMLEIKGAIVTIDAMGCQKELSRIIVKKNKADYVLTLKKNQQSLYEEVSALFKLAGTHPEIQTDSWESLEKGHGRIEKRVCTCISASPWLGHIIDGWTNLNTVAQIHSSVEKKGKCTEETRYFISSLPLDAEKIATAVRKHWSIENTLHWSLDVVYHEDACHIKKDNSPKNLAVLRRIGFNLAKPRTPEGMTTKRAQFRAILSQNFTSCHFLKF